MMEEEPRRIYSFNKACYIINCIPDVSYRMELDLDNLCTYFIFEDSERVERAIRNFGKDDCICFNFHKYLDIYGILKKKSIDLKNQYLCKLNKLDEKV